MAPIVTHTLTPFATGPCHSSKGKTIGAPPAAHDFSFGSAVLQLGGSATRPYGRRWPGRATKPVKRPLHDPQTRDIRRNRPPTRPEPLAPAARRRRAGAPRAAAA